MFIRAQANITSQLKHERIRKCPTMRAADDGWAARFLSFFAALSLFRLDGESKLQPIVANACRWAARQLNSQKVKMIVPHEKISRIALIVVGLLFLSNAAYLISQIFWDARLNYFQPSVVSGLLTGLLSVISLFLFLAWQKHFRYFLLAFFLFWLSFMTKDIAGFLAVEQRIMPEILVTIFRMMMSISLAIGIFQGELSRLLVRQEKR